MARFFGEVWGRKGSSTTTSASRTGAEAIIAHVRGWNIGIEAIVYKDENNNDAVGIRITGGSNAPNSGRVVVIDEKENERKEIEVSPGDLLFTFKIPTLREDL